LQSKLGIKNEPVHSKGKGKREPTPEPSAEQVASEAALEDDLNLDFSRQEQTIGDFRVIFKLGSIDFSAVGNGGRFTPRARASESLHQNRLPSKLHLKRH
jgi:hypothetical protein